MIDINSVKIGDKVHYRCKYFNKITKKIEVSYIFENGIIKEIIASDFVRVVYNCNDKWEDYLLYTSLLTETEDLYLGWI